MSQQNQPIPKKEYPPSQFKLINGKKWRLCAGAAVVNSKNHLLVGERTTVKGSWQAPQGGVDVGETITQAAARELYEEMGLVLNEHVVMDDDIHSEEDGYRYETSGTKNWLTKSGFAGQELHWVVFRCVDDVLEEHPRKVCDVSGKNGERAEFRDVKWLPMERVVEEVWEKKRDLYIALGEKLKKE